MPPSSRKGKTKAKRAAAVEAHEPSDAETPEAIPTPSRVSRKRARGGEPTAPAQRNTRRKTKDTRQVEREDTEGAETQDQTDNETEPATPTEADIVASLRTADRQVNATEDFANDLLEGQEHVPGYGKIAGRDWAFIIRKVEVNIGRPEHHERLQMDEASGQNAGPTSRTTIDIDLGPDRQVSRSHAVIAYEPETERWLIIVNGRNGLRVDNNLMKRGMKAYLRNGSVIEIANTQMAFITTANDDGEGPVWDASIIKQAQKSSEEEDDADNGPRSNGARNHAHPAPRASLQGNGYPPQYDGSAQQQQQHRIHPHSQRASMNTVPGTPVRAQQPYPRSSPAANYSRGVMMESTESIDYSAESAKDLKPPHSYAQLIGMAILSTHEQQMTLNNIYKWIMANYAFYRFNTGGWQNSIRHNLSLNKAFTKIARRTDEPGKGMKWMIEPSEFDMFVSQGMKGCRRPNPLPGTQSTTFDSPSSPMRVMTSGVNNPQRDKGQSTPRMPQYQSYPTAMEAYTPDRGSRRPLHNEAGGHGDRAVGLGIEGESQEYDLSIRSTPRNGLTAAANVSPPALYVNDESRVAMDTPFPRLHTQRFAPPSTLKRPSDFIQFSSPAPFWKMDGLVGSTPFKPYDLSPLKTPFSNIKKGADHKEHDQDPHGPPHDDAILNTSDAIEQAAAAEEKSKDSPIVPSSSPPRPSSSGHHALENSPTLSRPATAVAKTLSQLAASGGGKEFGSADAGSAAYSHQQPPTPTSRSSQQIVHQPSTASVPHLQSAPSFEHDNTVNGPSSHHLSQQPHGQPIVNGHHHNNNNGAHYNSHESAHHNNSSINGYSPLEDGDDEPIDLAKGFQPIGTFHQRNHMALMGMGMAGAGGFGR